MDSHADDDAALTSALRRLVQRLIEMPDDREPELTGAGARVQEHLGVDPTTLPLVVEQIPHHRLVDADLVLEELASVDESSILLGISGGQERWHEDFPAMLRHRFARFGADGPIEYRSAATGPRTTRQVVAMGLRLFRFEGAAMAVLQRDAQPRFGRDQATLEILIVDPSAAERFVKTLRRLMNERSVVRGNVVTFGHSEYGQGMGGMTFLERPTVTADDVVLPDGVLARIRDHVVGIGENATALRAHGQHLKRGVLLYGPPGTGKTLTVRHLLHETPGTTAVLLQGNALGLVTEAARLARAMTPAIVVLEDVDLVASERGMFGIQPLLFEVLDALDGLDGDADVAFVLTTNRADILEPALAARPGRVDLAVEVPLPDRTARRALLRVYAADLPLSPEILDAAADRSAGVTASFAKELIRRTVLAATLEGRDVVDADLVRALEDMLAAARGISAALFGGVAGRAGGGDGGDGSGGSGDGDGAGSADDGADGAGAAAAGQLVGDAGPGGPGSASFGWFAYQPLAHRGMHRGRPAPAGLTVPDDPDDA